MQPRVVSRTAPGPDKPSMCSTHTSSLQWAHAQTHVVAASRRLCLAWWTGTVWNRPSPVWGLGRCWQAGCPCQQTLCWRAGLPMAWTSGALLAAAQHQMLARAGMTAGCPEHLHSRLHAQQQDDLSEQSKHSARLGPSQCECIITRPPCVAALPQCGRRLTSGHQQRGACRGQQRACTWHFHA